MFPIIYAPHKLSTISFYFFLLGYLSQIRRKTMGRLTEVIQVLYQLCYCASMCEPAYDACLKAEGELPISQYLINVSKVNSW